MKEIEKQVIQSLYKAPIKTPGIIREEVKPGSGADDILKLLDNMVKKDLITYAEGEYGEYTIEGSPTPDYNHEKELEKAKKYLDDDQF